MKATVLAIVFGVILGLSGIRAQDVPDQFKQPVIVSMDTLDFAEYGLKYTPTYMIAEPPDPDNCRGVMCFSTHHDNIGASRGKGMEALLSGDKITALLQYMWEEYNLAVVIWNTFSPWRAAGPQVNEHEQSPEQAKMLNSMFDQIAAGLVKDMDKICQDFGYPKPTESDWFFAAGSDGSKHMVYVIPALPSGMFKACWFHGTTLFRNPSPSWKDENILMTVGQSDYGYGNYIDYYVQCQQLGYTNMIFRPDWKGHSHTRVAHSYAQRFFDWIMAGKPSEGGAYYADVVNLEVFPESQKDWIPEAQRVWLPNKEFADAFLEYSLEGPQGLVALDGDDFQWRLDSSVPAKGDWLKLADPPDKGNVVSIKFKMQKTPASTLGDHAGQVIFRDALVNESGRQDLVFRQSFSKGDAWLGADGGRRIGNGRPLQSNEDFDNPVDYELQYHLERKTVAVFANRKRAAFGAAELEFGADYTFGVGGEINDIQFGEPEIEGLELASLYLLSPADEGTGLKYKLQAAEAKGAVRWAEQKKPKPKKRWQFVTTMMTTQPNSQIGRNGFLQIEHAKNPAESIQIGFSFEKSGNTLKVFGQQQKPIKTAKVRFQRNKPVKLRVIHDLKNKNFSVFVNDGKKPALTFKRAMPIARVGTAVRGTSAQTNFGPVSIKAL